MTGFYLGGGIFGVEVTFGGDSKNLDSVEAVVKWSLSSSSLPVMSRRKQKIIIQWFFIAISRFFLLNFSDEMAN